MSTTYTSGPWMQYAHGNQVYGGDRFFITAVQSKNPEADARLIAAAPELLEALKVIAECIEAGDAVGGDIDDWMNKARTAIAKAEGRS